MLTLTIYNKEGLQENSYVSLINVAFPEGDPAIFVVKSTTTMNPGCPSDSESWSESESVSVSESSESWFDPCLLSNVSESSSSESGSVSVSSESSSSTSSESSSSEGLLCAYVEYWSCNVVGDHAEWVKLGSTQECVAPDAFTEGWVYNEAWDYWLFIQYLDQCEDTCDCSFSASDGYAAILESCSCVSDSSSSESVSSESESSESASSSSESDSSSSESESGSESWSPDEWASVLTELLSVASLSDMSYYPDTPRNGIYRTATLSLSFDTEHYRDIVLQALVNDVKLNAKIQRLSTPPRVVVVSATDYPPPQHAFWF